VDVIRSIIEAAGFTLVLLEKYTDTADFARAVADADALIVRSDKVTADIIAAAGNLKIVVRAGAGYDNLDLTACSSKGIVAMNTPGQNSNAVAELALGMMVYMARNSFEPGTGSELKGKKLGIHAYGNVGRQVARIARGFGMEVLAFDPFITSEAMQQEGITPVKSVQDLYKKCTYVSLHIPATEETRKSIGQELLMSMPKGGTLINTARKEVIDEDGLLRAMMERNDLKYATDIAPDCASKLKNSVGSRYFGTAKKMGAETAEANVNAGLAAASQIVDFFTTGSTKFRVN